MELFDKIKNLLTKTKGNDLHNIKSVYENNTSQEFNVEYPELYSRCFEIYNMITNYECQLLEREDILTWKNLYLETKNEEWLKEFEEAKHKLFIRPQVVQGLIAVGRDIYGLNKEGFFNAINIYFGLIATNKEFSPEFCFKYLHDEIEKHYHYYPVKHVDFKKVINKCFVSKNSKMIEKWTEFSKENKCPYCEEQQEKALIRSKKCYRCGEKIYVSKLLDRVVYLKEVDYQYLKEEQEKNKTRQDFCYMILKCGTSEEELESYLNDGNINRVNDLAWRKLSEYRNKCFENGQIDLLPNINLNMAKVLIYEHKYKTAIRFLCESIYEKGSALTFHPGYPYKEVNGKIQNIYKIDIERYNERHRPYLDKYSMMLLLSLKEYFNESEYEEEIRSAFAESSNYYLEKTPDMMWKEVMDALDLLSTK